MSIRRIFRVDVAGSVLVLTVLEVLFLVVVVGKHFFKSRADFGGYCAGHDVASLAAGTRWSKLRRAASPDNPNASPWCWGFASNSARVREVVMYTRCVVDDIFAAACRAPFEVAELRDYGGVIETHEITWGA